jgi:hypothetical protein
MWQKRLVLRTAANEDMPHSGMISVFTFPTGGMPRCSLLPRCLGFFCEHPLPQSYFFPSDDFSNIAYYGISLNQSIILKDIGFGTGSTPWETLHKTAVGNVIVSFAVCIPSYSLAFLGY